MTIAGEPESHAEPVVLSWSGGKDSALALAALRASRRYTPVALLTCLTADYDRISIHGVRRELLHVQANAVGLPLQEMWLEPNSSNARYEAALATALEGILRAFPLVRAIAFGDLFLEDVRQYREALLAGLGFHAVFPLWGQPTEALAQGFVRQGYAARVVCVDTQLLPAHFAGREYDATLLRELPTTIDPCGERGEFHTFVSSGPQLSHPVPYAVGDVVLRDGRFAYCDLLSVEAGQRVGS
jgi:uncharacterized protein (TIGR00290 family)